MASSLKSAGGPALSSTNGAGKETDRKRKLLPSFGEFLSGIKRRATGAATPQARRVSQDESEAAASSAIEPVPFSALAEGPYFIVAQFLGAHDLARTDATCRLLRMLNAQPFGPWQSLGESAFLGMELDVGGGFLPFEGDKSLKTRMERGRQNWKGRYKLFYQETPTFSAPFKGGEISVVEHPDEVAYCRCRLRTDLLADAHSDCGVYVEVEIRQNADNLSLAVVDFEGGGRSSVTFSPETGAVLRERKVRESPRAIEGTYIHLLPAAPAGHRFEGIMGLYLRNGHLAFFRRWSVAPEAATAPGDGAEDAEDDVAMGGAVSSAASAPQPVAADGQTNLDTSQSATPSWETTGFCTDLGWASGQRLSMCLAFRDDGNYNVRINKVCRSPPIAPHKSEAAYQDGKWNHLYGDDDHPLAI